MKANKFFLGLALIGAILTGCEKDKTGNQGDYDTTSYMTVSIAQVGGTRAVTDGGYIDGNELESKVKTVDFYFYDSEGNAFDFTSAQDGGNNTYETNRYHYEPTHNPTNGTGKNIDELIAAHLVIKHNKGNIPAKMIAVINSTKDYSTYNTLESVQKDVLTSGVNEDGTHIMTNSVYKGADGKVVMETPITTANLALNESIAIANPVKIYVERTVARVEVLNGADNTTVFDTETDILAAGNGTTTHVYAKIVGWDIVTYANNGTLAKQIDAKNWADAINGMTWNRPAEYRSWWALADKKAEGALTKEFSWNSLSNGVGSIDYCFENTTLPKYDTFKNAAGEDVEDLDKSRTNVTKVVIAAELYSDNAGTTPIYVANWYGSNYDLDGLKAVVAQSLKNDLILLGTDGGYTPITAAQIDVATNEAEVQNSYEVYFTLAKDVPTTGWYKLGVNGYESVADPNAVLRGVENAKIWNGKSYYIVNIEHLGVDEKSDEKTYLEAYYGVVRNHAYQIKFTKVVGLGTPVYNPETIYPEPVTPEHTESYVAAEINVLAWHLVQQTVTLQ